MGASAASHSSQLPDNIAVKPSCISTAVQLHYKTVHATIPPVTGIQLLHVIGSKSPLRRYRAFYIQELCKL